MPDSEEPTVAMLDERTGALDRFQAPLYTIPEGARYLDVPATTLDTWTHGYRRHSANGREAIGQPVLRTLPRSGRGKPVIAFIGLAEGVVLAAMLCSPR